MKVSVLRLGHRPERDKRVTTHCALAARALGASKMYYTGIKDETFEASIKKVVNHWGGNFQVEHIKSWKNLLEGWKGKVAHLTMYGKDYKKIKVSTRELLVIVGGGKVPPQVYDMVDYNIAVTGQPHSEIAALALFLEKLNLTVKFDKAMLRIEPRAKGKKVVTNNKRK